MNYSYTKSAIPITLIVACAQNGVIGKNNQLPWHLPRDLAYFKRITTGCPIIMGRKTYESIGKALPNRLNVVVSRNPNYHPRDAFVASDVSIAIATAIEQQPDANEIHVIGGARIFAEALSLINKIYFNRVLADIDGDTYLPAIDWSVWKKVHSEHHTADNKNSYAMDFEIYEKI